MVPVETNEGGEAGENEGSRFYLKSVIFPPGSFSSLNSPRAGNCSSCGSLFLESCVERQCLVHKDSHQ